MKARTVAAWSWIHKWSSLVCTLFMLLLCLTGLPLIFHHEIEYLAGDAVSTAEMPADTPRFNLDQLVDNARARFPGKYVMYLSQEEDDKSFWYVALADRLDETEKFDVAVLDARTGEHLKAPDFYSGFMYWMARLHIDLFMGLPGMLFLGFMGLLLVLSIVSGVVLYAPFMQKLRYGEVRRARSRRLYWLDLHNLLGITTVAWALVVGVTGVINTLEEPTVSYWREHHLQPWLAQYGDGEPPPPTRFASLDAAVRQAEAEQPGMQLSYIAFPGVLGGTPHHYSIYLQGSTPFTSKLYQPVLVDVLTGESAGSVPPPWYLQALYLSQPLHFGDYGGMPMKILWAVLDLITIVVLVSGLYLWLWKPGRQGRPLARPDVSPAGAAAVDGGYRSAPRPTAAPPVFRIPLLLAGLTLLGLIAGLLGDGLLDGLAWAGLGLPVLLGLHKALDGHGRRRGRQGDDQALTRPDVRADGGVTDGLRPPGPGVPTQP